LLLTAAQIGNFDADAGFQNVTADVIPSGNMISIKKTYEGLRSTDA
jgi:hypothetical protein